MTLNALSIKMRSAKAQLHFNTMNSRKCNGVMSTTSVLNVEDKG